MPWYFFSKHGSPDLPDAGTSSLQTGQVYPYLGAMTGIFGSELQAKTAPTGFLFCNGASMDQLEFPDLYNYFILNGVSFGAAAVGFFKIPDTQDRAPMGSGTNPVGTTGGASTHTHTGAGTHNHNLASHPHLTTNHTHFLGIHTHTHASHTHGASNLNPFLNTVGKLHTVNTDSSPGAHTRRRTAPVTHSHDILGSSAATGLLTGGPSSNTSGSINPSPPATLSTSGVISGTESVTANFPSIGNDNIPPYTNINFMVKT